MVTKEELLKILHNELPVLKGRFSVIELGLFGSFVKNEARNTSDIDILVSIEDSKNNIFNFLDLKYYLEDVLQNRVDLVMKDGIKPRIKDQILEETVYA